MAKSNRNLKKADKLSEEKARLLKREAMLLELKSYSISKDTQSKLGSIVKSNMRMKKGKLPLKVNS